ncbi:hypothetical protein [Amycolatopsis viridis]|uniref:Uncharacterized protein n=1 Tax=Amycolatopsis viridis TaxID=185678 RepID=A0ABX0SKZ5_9PSEU|nr:hypothetical protein [Amycolatopsis viridis]NIH77657.1 hypothetical protein [Amycolatopsis viridis]
MSSRDKEILRGVQERPRHEAGGVAWVGSTTVMSASSVSNSS